MRLLGIDYGTKRVGFALSDPEREFAFPHCVLPNDKDLALKIREICNKENVDTIIIGKSLDYKQKDNPIMGAVRTLKNMLQKEIRVPVYFESEFLTTVEARRFQGNHSMTDASAAALILQSYINRNKK
ncbi:pre-16S rRNA-processing nuclease YqgF [Patescibacteria group bacterium]|nr:pre-16S rRNA-processing nuclease YqgF [Patescibacteria group bacterium]